MSHWLTMADALLGMSLVPVLAVLFVLIGAANGRIDYEPMRGGAAECRAVAAAQVASGTVRAARCNVEGMMGDAESGGVPGWTYQRGVGQ